MDLQQLTMDELDISAAANQSDLDLSRSASWQLRQGKQAGSLLAAASELETPLSRRMSSCLLAPAMSPRASCVGPKGPIRCEDPMMAWPAASSPDAASASLLPHPARSQSPCIATAMPGRRSAPHSACHSPRHSMDCAFPGLNDGMPSPASPRRPSFTILNSPGRQSLNLSGSFAGLASPSPASSPIPMLAQRAASINLLADDCCNSSGSNAGQSGGGAAGDGRRMQLSKSGHWKPFGTSAGEALQSQTHRALQQLHAGQHSSSLQRSKHHSADGRLRGELRRRTSESQLHDLRASCQGEVQHWAQEAAKMRHGTPQRPLAMSDAGAGAVLAAIRQERQRQQRHLHQQGQEEQQGQQHEEGGQEQEQQCQQGSEPWDDVLNLNSTI